MLAYAIKCKILNSIPSINYYFKLLSMFITNHSYIDILKRFKRRIVYAIKVQICVEWLKGIVTPNQPKTKIPFNYRYYGENSIILNTERRRNVSFHKNNYNKLQFNIRHFRRNWVENNYSNWILYLTDVQSREWGIYLNNTFLNDLKYVIFKFWLNSRNRNVLL